MCSPIWNHSKAHIDLAPFALPGLLVGALGTGSAFIENYGAAMRASFEQEEEEVKESLSASPPKTAEQGDRKARASEADSKVTAAEGDKKEKEATDAKTKTTVTKIFDTIKWSGCIAIQGFGWTLTRVFTVLAAVAGIPLIIYCVAKSILVNLVVCLTLRKVKLLTDYSDTVHKQLAYSVAVTASFVASLVHNNGEFMDDAKEAIKEKDPEAGLSAKMIFVLTLGNLAKLNVVFAGTMTGVEDSKISAINSQINQGTAIAAMMTCDKAKEIFGGILEEMGIKAEKEKESEKSSSSSKSEAPPRTKSESSSSSPAAAAESAAEI